MSKHHSVLYKYVQINLILYVKWCNSQVGFISRYWSHCHSYLFLYFLISKEKKSKITHKKNPVFLSWTIRNLSWKNAKWQCRRNFLWQCFQVSFGTYFFKIKIWRTWVLFVGPLIPLFWTSGDFSPEFQSQGGSLACVLPRLRTTDSWDSPLVRHLLTSWQPAWLPVVFPTCYICSRGRMPGFDQETSRTISRLAIHSATATGFFWYIFIFWIKIR